MDYNKINKTDIDGDGNILLQDVNGQNITINYNDTKEFSKLLSFANDTLTSEIQELIKNHDNDYKDFTQILNTHFELPPEIKELKKQLKIVVRENYIKIASLTSLQNNEGKDGEDARPSRKNRNLLRALQEQKCVLFIGPEMSINDKGESLHEEFYKELAADTENDLIYHEKEGFFQPNDDPWFNSDIQNFYEKEFPKKNKIGEEILTTLAQLPFNLTVSMAPDDTLHNIYKKYDKEHEYLFYDKSKLAEVKISQEKPVILNMLGSPVFCESDWQYIFTHNDFYDFIKSYEITGNIKNEIQNAVHYLFIGFDFNKWHNRMILYVLDIIESKDKKIRQVVEPDKLSDFSKDFLEKQFNISYIEEDYMKFLKEISESAKDAKIYTDFETEFAQKQSLILEKLADKLFDADKMTILKEIEVELEELTEKLSK